MSEPLLIDCLRHGVTEANLAGRFNGAGDEPLSGTQRGRLLEIAFDWTPYDAIFASPLRRAVETAECLRIPKWTLEPRIAERDFGIFEGLTPEECERRFPEAYAAFRVIDADFVVPNGESRAQNLSRVLDWVQDLATYRRVLAITHGGTIDFLYRLGSGLPLHGGNGIYASENASMSTFAVEWPAVRMITYGVRLVA